MKLTFHNTYRGYLAGAVMLFFAFFNQGCSKLGDVFHQIEHKNPVLKSYNQVNLVSNNNEYGASHMDAHLLNAWGLAFSNTGIAWISSNGGHVSSVYDKDGNMLTARPEVAIPSATDTIGGVPSGTVLNGDTAAADFKLSNGAAARFFFVGEDGVVSGWNGAAGNSALKITTTNGANYKGVTMAQNAGGWYLYAANFASGKIDVWDKDFNTVNLPFTDPNLPSGYGPFNIQLVGGDLYVMYAKVGPDTDEVKGMGLGYVDVYKTNGMLKSRFASNDKLNAPWGVAWAPDAFFTDADGNPTPAILVGNFGDGYINVYNTKGTWIGQLTDAHGKTIQIEGLWALMFPPATATAIDPDRLYFTAGPDDENDGLFGYITK
ncbi:MULTISPECIES: TIGR03118 family protein [Niastella]|uniref:TIGR03118 family protein n=1 Tax=Niastella soli TaxID=2821487 RepID=A0ABS3Z2R1_9BACT|nr:TIGR03118 family protein [Niastella soli]MBO9204451.1 TIGR03118 family protein [Niastella soli]